VKNFQNFHLYTHQLGAGFQSAVAQGRCSIRLAHSGTCDATALDCVLPVNANITLLNTGAGGITDVRVSIDIYANNRTGTPEPAILSSSARAAGVLTIRRSRIRVILPRGFQLCKTSVLQGGPSGITLTTFNLTGHPISVRRGLSYVAAEAQSAGDTGRTEPIYGSLERVGAVRSSQESPIDPCRPISGCIDRIFEMTSTDEMIDFRSSTVRGQIERLEFTIANVINRAEPGQVTFFGPTQSDLTRTKSVFSVQLLDYYDTTTPSVTHRYWNNRINDPTLNLTAAPWFACTNTRPVILGANRFWTQSVQLEPSRTNAVTRATVTLETYSEWPAGGFARVTFPSQFRLTRGQTTVTARTSTMSGSVPLASFIVDENENSVFLQRSTAVACTDTSNVDLAPFCAVPRNAIITLIVNNVRTPNVTGGVEVAGGILTERFRVEIGAGLNATLDAGNASGVVLGATDLLLSNSISVTMDSYTAGRTNTRLFFTFMPMNSGEAGGFLTISIPAADFTLSSASVATSTDLDIRASPAVIRGPSVTFRVNLTSGYTAGNTYSVTISGLTNRAFSGPASSTFGVRLFNENGLMLDFADAPLASAFLASNFVSSSVIFPRFVASSGNITVQFTVTNELPPDGRLVLLVPTTVDLSAMPGVFAGPGKLQGEHLAAEVTRQANFQEILIRRSGGGARVLPGESASFAIPGVSTPAYVIDTVFTLSTQVCNCF
jgi:hypothetical protein